MCLQYHSTWRRQLREPNRNVVETNSSGCVPRGCDLNYDPAKNPSETVSAVREKHWFGFCLFFSRNNTVYFLFPIFQEDLVLAWSLHFMVRSGRRVLLSKVKCRIIATKGTCWMEIEHVDVSKMAVGQESHHFASVSAYACVCVHVCVHIQCQFLIGMSTHKHAQFRQDFFKLALIKLHEPMFAETLCSCLCTPTYTGHRD